MNQYKKVAFYTLGCKLNFAETSTISRLFEEDGFAKVDFNEQPDIYVINTCSVTDNADKRCRALVRKALRINPNAFVVLIGCYAQLKPKEISEIPGVDLVLGANEKFNLLKHIDSLEKNEKATIVDGKIKEVKEFFPSYSIGDRTRTFLKVQDGCDYFCSFCTIPLARGTSRSNTIEETLKVAKEISQTEVKEIVLTGVNIGDFGKGTEETFYDLVVELDKLEGVDRIRISSIEPNLLSNEIIEFTSLSKKFVPHFHIPLQSGSNEMLQSMRRRYKRELYAERVEKIKALMPECCIGVDVIVGFPGETDEHFSETMSFLRDIDVSYFHVFTYSERANTTAVRNENTVPKSVRAERSKMLQILSNKKKRAFYESQVGKTFPVLFENDNEDNYYTGFTPNYVKVKVYSEEKLTNKIIDVQLKKVTVDCLMESELITEKI